MVFIAGWYDDSMNLNLLTSTSLIIVTHLIFALLAIVIGALQLLLIKGSARHKILGYIWTIAMAIICLSSFGIKTVMPDGIFGGFSPIHLLSIWVLFQLARSIHFARNHEIARHRKTMVYTYFGGLIIAGAFTLMPGRLLYKVLITPWF